jgi:hypothetical protein
VSKTTRHVYKIFVTHNGLGYDEDIGAPRHEEEIKIRDVVRRLTR